MSRRSNFKWSMLSALGGEMLEVREGYACGKLPLSELVKQPSGVYHAGAITTLADEVASAAIHGEEPVWESFVEKKFPYSVQISVNLLTNDPEGPIFAESNVVKRGGLTVVDTIVKTSRGETAALMRSTHKMVDPRKVGPHIK